MYITLHAPSGVGRRRPHHRDADPAEGRDAGEGAAVLAGGPFDVVGLDAQKAPAYIASSIAEGTSYVLLLGVVNARNDVKGTEMCRLVDGRGVALQRHSALYCFISIVHAEYDIKGTGLYRSVNPCWVASKKKSLILRLYRFVDVRWVASQRA